MAQTVGVVARFDTSQFNAGLKTYVNGLTVATNVTVQTTDQVNKLNTAFSAGLGAAVGTAAINAIQGIARALGNLTTQVVSTVAEFERLSFTFSTFIAREFQETSGIDNFKTALAATTDQAAAYQLQIEKLAIESPVATTQQIGQLTQLGLAYDFTSSEILRINRALLDTAAATGTPFLSYKMLSWHWDKSTLAACCKGKNYDN